MDGVLADMDTALAALAEQEFGRAPAAKREAATPEPADAPTPADGAGATAPEASASAGASPSASPSAPAGPAELPTTAVLEKLTSRQQTRLWNRVAETRNFWEGLAEHEPGTVRHLQKLAHDRRWDVLFVTQRPSTTGRTVQLQTQHWLRRHGFDCPSVYTTLGSRGKIAAALTLDVHVDDRLNNAMDIATESKAWSILVWRDEATFTRISTGAAQFGIATVRTVGEAIAKIEDADKASAEQAAQGTVMGRLKRVFRGR